MKRIASVLCAAVAVAAFAADPAPEDFQWRATVDTAGRSGLLRAALPADALMRVQSPAANDLRVFDRAGRSVPFALASPPQAAATPELATQEVLALPLHTARAGGALPSGALQVQIANGPQGQTVWVQAGPPAATTVASAVLPAALFDTRGLQQAVGALRIRATLPVNTPVLVTLSTSEDLATWTPVRAQGRLYRFEGEGAPANDRLELPEPLQLKKRFLRLDWAGQEGVTVQAVTGIVLPAQPVPQRPGVTLGAPRTDGSSALEWTLPSALPIVQLEIAPTQANSLVPVRILGRRQAGEPWRPLAQAVLYRLGSTGQESSNPPVTIAPASLRSLRIEATYGARLQDVPLQVVARFAPVDLVFVAGDQGPYTIAAGRADTAAAALPVGMIAAASTTPLQDLPQARLTEVRSAAAPAPSVIAAHLPEGVDARSATLWAVLLVGVVVLGGVAWSLLRQVNAPPP